MSAKLLTLRYPDGPSAEVRSEAIPREGDELQNNGDTWIVEEVLESDEETTVVKVRPVPKPVEIDEDG